MYMYLYDILGISNIPPLGLDSIADHCWNFHQHHFHDHYTPPSATHHSPFQPPPSSIWMNIEWSWGLDVGGKGGDEGFEPITKLGTMPMWIQHNAVQCKCEYKTLQYNAACSHQGEMGVDEYNARQLTHPLVLTYIITHSSGAGGCWYWCWWRCW